MSIDIATQRSDEPVRPSTLARGGALSAIIGCFFALASLFGIDALLFRTSLYTSVIEPASSTGRFEYTLQRELDFQAKAGDNLVVTIGDSRFNYLPRLANELTPTSGYVFRSAGVAGSDPRSWYYMLRDLDRDARRYRAIVIAVDDYDDEDTFDEHEDDIRALHFVIARLRLSDVIDFSRSFRTAALRWEAFRGASLKGFVYQRDIQALLSNPVRRFENAKFSRGGFAEWAYNYVEDPHSLAGLQIDWEHWAASFPPGVDESQRDTVKHFLMHDVAPQTGTLARFRREWLGRIINRYRNSRTKVIFVRLARGPIPRPEGLVRKRSSSIREFASRPNVFLCNEHAFDSLEYPELFKDALHLNRAGVARFSTMLVEEVRKILSPPERPGI